MKVLDVRDTINGKEGFATSTFEDGKVEDMFNINSLKVEYERIKKEIKSVGRRATQYKVVGWKGTGTMTTFAMSPTFKRKCMEYAETGKDFYFEINVVNNDPDSTAGQQTVTLRECNIDKMTLTELLAEDDVLKEEIPFTYSDVSITDEYTMPTR